MIDIILGIATVIGGIAALGYFLDVYRRKKENTLIQDNTIRINEKKLPYDILDHIDIDNSLDYIKEILASPHKIEDTIHSAFSDEEIKTTVWLYSFSNAQLCIESDDGKSVSVITLQVYDESEPFELPVVENMKKLTMGDVMDELGFDSDRDKFIHFASMRDGYILLECYFGRIGMYRTYTFGCYDCPEVHEYELVDNKFISAKGEVFDGRSIEINFISISHDENRGHPVGYI